MTGITLRPYQEKAVQEVRDAFVAGHDAVLLQLPTGGGKTLTSGYMIGGAAARGNDAWFICNRVELVEQTALAFDKLGLTYGIIAAGFTGNPRERIQIASIDTLKSRLKKPAELAKLRLPKMRVYDECRSMGSAGWTAVYELLKANGGMDLGLDATPTRLDGKGLDGYFSHLVQGPSYSDLIQLGSLVPFEVFGPTSADLSGVKMKGDDYDQAAVESIFDEPTLVGDVPRHYRQLADGKQGITFAVSRKHSEHLAESYRAAGVAAVHVDGDTDKGERKRIISAFRRGEIRILCNVDLFTAGFDAPGVEVITMVRPTKSLPIYLQQAGRGSRPEPSIGKTHCTLIDHTGNWFTHGLPDMDRTWTLEGRTRKQRKLDEEEMAESVRQCESCYFTFKPTLPACPKCGTAPKLSPRQIKQVEGELQRIDAEAAAAAKAAQKADEKAARDQRKAEDQAVRSHRASALKKAKSLDDLRAHAKEFGYGDGWAEATHAARKKIAEQYSQRRAESQFEAYRR